MYIGAVLALAGAALFYESLSLLGYTAPFLLATHLLVVGYEEPALRRSFGPEYEAYSTQVASSWRPDQNDCKLSQELPRLGSRLRIALPYKRSLIRTP